MESVLLKRRLMGPSWLTLACPTRVDAGAQVQFNLICSISWAMLEKENVGQPLAVHTSGGVQKSQS